MTIVTRTVYLEEFSARATAEAVCNAIRKACATISLDPVGFMVPSDVWDHILYRADVLTEFQPDGSLLGYSGFLGLPVAVDGRLKQHTVDIIFSAATWQERMKHARQVAPATAAEPEIKIAPAMIEAGLHALKSRYQDLVAPELDLYPEILCAVYRAMEKSRIGSATGSLVSEIERLRGVIDDARRNTSDDIVRTDLEAALGARGVEKIL